MFPNQNTPPPGTDAPRAKGQGREDELNKYGGSALTKK